MAWEWNNNPQNPDAEPVFAGIFGGASWQTYDWMIWHQAMTHTYGQNYANQTFVETWNSSGLFSTAPVNGAAMDNAFKAYMQSAGIWESMEVGLAGRIGSWVNGILDTGDSLAAGAKAGADTTKWLLPAVLIGAVVVIALPYATASAAKAKRAAK